MESISMYETRSTRARSEGGGLAHRADPKTLGSQFTNVGATERVVSSLLGGALLLNALRRPTPVNAAAALGAGALLHRGVTGHCYVYQALGRNELNPTERPQRSITIEAPAEALYRAWQDPQRVAQMMGDFATIEAQPDGRWLWRAKLPMGKSVEWTTATIETTPNQRIAWRTGPDAPIAHEGSVQFQPAPRDWGTVVTLRMTFGSPGTPLSKLTSMFPKLPKTLEQSILRRCKNLLVAGEIPTLRRNPSARATEARRAPSSLTHSSVQANGR